MKKDIVICFIILIVTAALCTLCAVMLPQEVVVQVDLRGHPSNVMSKSAAIILPSLCQ